MRGFLIVLQRGNGLGQSGWPIPTHSWALNLHGKGSLMRELSGNDLKGQWEAQIERGSFIFGLEDDHEENWRGGVLGNLDST